MRADVVLNERNAMSFKLEHFNERTQRQIKQQLESDIQLKNTGQASKLERIACDAPVDAKEIQGQYSGRVLVRVTSRRKRLLDEDNLCEKYHVDLCRYAGIISDDAPERTKIEVSQIKCRKGEPEEITIEVIRL
jgi:hypothetical protein